MVFGFSLTLQSFLLLFFSIFFFKYYSVFSISLICVSLFCLCDFGEELFWVSLGTNPTSYKSQVHVTVSRTYVECVCTCGQSAMDRAVRYFEWFQWLRARTETLCLGLAEVYGLLRRVPAPLTTFSNCIFLCHESLFLCKISPRSLQRSPVYKRRDMSQVMFKTDFVS